jgi:chemotaxis protein CheD
MVSASMTNSAIPVKMCEIVVLKGSGVLCCPGLGSCVAVAALDPTTGIGGMAHVMLPKSFEDNADERPARFADLAVPNLLKILGDRGARISELKLALVGGAHVLRLSSNSEIDIGARNAEAILSSIDALGLKVIEKDLGGVEGRTVTYSLEDGNVMVRKLAQKDRVICSLAA